MLADNVGSGCSQVTAYKAGHVLGAAMFMVEIAGLRVLYTGDYSRQPDRHLPGAETPPEPPHICESPCTLTSAVIPDRHLHTHHSQGIARDAALAGKQKIAVRTAFWAGCDQTLTALQSPSLRQGMGSNLPMLQCNMTA